MVIEVLILSLTFIIFALRRLTQNLPPGPHPWPIIGNMHQIRLDNARQLNQLSRVYGPILSFYYGSSLNVIVSNTWFAKEVLKNHDQQLANRHRAIGIARFSRNGDDLTWADYGPRFVKLKKLCMIEMFSLKNLEAHRSGREDEVSAMIDSVYKNHRGKVFEVRNCLNKVVFNSLARMLFGKSFVGPDGELDNDGRKLKSIMEAQFKAKVSLGLVEEVWWLRWIPWLIGDENKPLATQNHRFFKALIHERELERDKNHTMPPNLLDALLIRREEYDLSDDTISGLLWDMVTAGIDTSVIVVEWAMTELLKNPLVQQKAQEELDSVIELGEVMTESDIPKLPYLRCLVKETLRLHPPTPLMLPHKASNNLTIGKYHVPKGSRLFVNIWAMGRDENVWKDPLIFQPERFVEEDIDIKGHDFRLLPFGSGRRVCPGVQLGINLVTLMLGRLLHHFEWALPEGVRAEDIDMLEKFGIVTYKNIPFEAVPNPRFIMTFYSYPNECYFRTLNIH